VIREFDHLSKKGLRKSRGKIVARDSALALELVVVEMKLLGFGAVPG
jgi:hypothetical protein